MMLFKFCVPSLLGYALFVGISGQINPILRPRRANERANWCLGLWIGLSITLTLILSLHMAYGMSSNGVRQLIAPSLWLMLTLTIPAMLGYLLFRRSASEIAAERTTLANSTLETPLFNQDTHVFGQVRPLSSVDETTRDDPDSGQNEANNVVATFLDTAQLTLETRAMLEHARICVESSAVSQARALDCARKATQVARQSNIRQSKLESRLTEAQTRYSNRRNSARPIR